MDVALELAALGVLGRYQALLGGLQLGEARLQRGGEALVPKHETGLCGEVPHQGLLGWVHRIVRRHRHRQRPEELSLVSHLGCELGVSVGVTVLLWPHRHLPEVVADLEPHPSGVGADTLCQDPRRAGQDVVG